MTVEQEFYAILSKLAASGALRHLALVGMRYRGLMAEVPEPEVWAIHKIAISQLRCGENKALKRANDLSVARRVVERLGEEKILARAEEFKGKFLRLFRQGWAEYRKDSFSL